MPKRTLDTEILARQEIRNLSCTGKLFFFFYLTHCDFAGLWLVDWPLAQLRMGCELKPDQLKKEFSSLIIELEDGARWFMPFFLETQYGQLNTKVKCHNSVVKLLSRYRECNKELNKFTKGLCNPSETLSKGLYLYINNKIESNKEEEDITLTKGLGNPYQTLSKPYNRRGIEFEIKQLKTVAGPREEIEKLEAMLEREYYVGDETIHDIPRLLEEEFQILMNGLRSQYGSAYVNKQMKEFGQHHLQGSWKDQQDLRHHFTNYLRKQYENRTTRSTTKPATAKLDSGNDRSVYSEIKGWGA